MRDRDRDKQFCFDCDSINTVHCQHTRDYLKQIEREQSFNKIPQKKTLTIFGILCEILIHFLVMFKELEKKCLFKIHKTLRFFFLFYDIS